MSAKRKLVLAVDDSEVMRRLVTSMLTADGFDVISVESGDQALQAAKNDRPDVILLDIDMPGRDGYEICQALKNDSATALIPIVFVTAQAKTSDKVRGLDLGAIDYVTKPFDHAELKARVRSAYRVKYLIDMLDQRAQIDALTGLSNRACFDQRLPDEIERARRYRHELSILFMDLDRFKLINDTYGHLFGDVVLNDVGDLLRRVARQGDVVARYGGEEFVVIAPEQDLDGAGLFAMRILHGVRSLEPAFRSGPIPVTVSIGVASLSNTSSGDAAELIEAADKALYHAKHTGRNRICVWQNGKAEIFEPSLAPAGP